MGEAFTPTPFGPAPQGRSPTGRDGPNGVRPTASPDAKDFFIELPRRDTSSADRVSGYNLAPWMPL
jgi:hypothetical protein